MGHLGGYVIILTLVVTLTAALLYLGFIMPAPRPGSSGYLFWSYVRGRNRGGFLFVAIILVPLAGFALWQASRVESQITLLVEPYPNVTETAWVPDVDGDPGAETYLIKTDDSADAVLAYYTIPSRRPGWELVAENEGMLQLEREEETLFIVATEDGRQTTIAYLLSGG